MARTAPLHAIGAIIALARNSKKTGQVIGVLERVDDHLYLVSFDDDGKTDYMSRLEIVAVNTGKTQVVAPAGEPAKRGPGRPPKPREPEPTADPEPTDDTPPADDVPADDADVPTDDATADEPEPAPAPVAPKSDAKAEAAKRDRLKVAFKSLLANKGTDAGKAFLAKFKAANLAALKPSDFDAAAKALGVKL